MSYISVGKKIAHPELPKNKLGLTIKAYGGVPSTLCGGCGHDSISAGMIQAFFELDIPPHRMMKLSGIGCSSKMPAYFLSSAHGLNAVHGRMPSIATGAHAGRRDVICVGISGDGDSLSIGLGQFVHLVRRRAVMTYVIANNGVFGLTKGQFSASADLGAVLKGGKVNPFSPIDPIVLSIELGASFVARAFSGDKSQMVPILKAAIEHPGMAVVDVISPCVTFNEHNGSTKSYKATRARQKTINEVLSYEAEFAPGEVKTVHFPDGTSLKLRRREEDFDPSQRDDVLSYLRACRTRNEVATGVLYVNHDQPVMHEIQNTVATPLADLALDQLIPSANQFDEMLRPYR